MSFYPLISSSILSTAMTSSSRKYWEEESVPNVTRTSTSPTLTQRMATSCHLFFQKEKIQLFATTRSTPTPSSSSPEPTMSSLSSKRELNCTSERRYLSWTSIERSQTPSSSTSRPRRARQTTHRSSNSSRKR